MMHAARISVLLLFAASPVTLRAEDKRKWPAEIEQAIARADKNRAELEKALRDSPATQRQGMEFLVANMPDSDLRSLKADFLLENLDLAYKARQQVAWGDKVPEAIFLNNVLAYAN